MTTVLISGAGIAGPVLAYWLAERGLTPTIVERVAQPLDSGGHAVDLAGTSLEVIERMGLLEQVRSAAVQHNKARFHRPGKSDLTMDRLTTSLSENQVEIQRDDLIRILHAATADRVEYLRGDSIDALTEDADGVTVTFAGGTRRRFDLVAGADGLHSRVRQLTFGGEEQFRHFLGGYLVVFSYPNHLGLDGEVVGFLEADRAAFSYAVDDGTQARALLLFRSEEELDVHHRDTARQRELVRAAFEGGGWELPRLLSCAEDAEDFYFDSISQIRMDSWSRGRITLVGDAGFSPGPAVGGGTALAVVSAYVLAAELGASDADHTVAFEAYERILRDPVAQGHKVGPSSMKQLIPRTPFAARLTPHLLRALTRLPRRFALALFSLQGTDSQTLDDLTSSPGPSPGGRSADRAA